MKKITTILAGVAGASIGGIGLIISKGNPQSFLITAPLSFITGSIIGTTTSEKETNGPKT